MRTTSVVVAIALSLGCDHGAAAQPQPSPDIPVRLTWSALNQDGYAMVTFTNDTPAAITAWALGLNIVRPDGSKVVRPGSKADFWAGLIVARFSPGRPVVGPVFLPSTPYTHAVRVGDPAGIADFSVFLTAVVFDDGSVVGNRADVAMFLASREIDATEADAWGAAFQAAADAPDRDTAVGLLQQAIDGGAPARRVGVPLKNLAQQAIRDRADDARFKAVLDDALQKANVYATEGRRHLNPGAPR